MPGDHCAHVESIMSRQQLGAVESQPAQHRFCSHLLELYVMSKKCRRCACWLSTLLVSVSGAVEANVESWGDGHWQSRPEALQQGPKRRKMDEHVKQHVLDISKGSATVTERAKHILGGSAEMGIRFRWADVAALRASLLLSGAKADVVGIAADCTRL
eukprot:2971833-Amphidinium_carterae.1